MFFILNTVKSIYLESSFRKFKTGTMIIATNARTHKRTFTVFIVFNKMLEPKHKSANATNLKTHKDPEEMSTMCILMQCHNVHQNCI